jgi:hypothetical protein
MLGVSIGVFMTSAGIVVGTDSAIWIHGFS